MPLSGAEFNMRMAAMQQEQAFRDGLATGAIAAPRDVLSKDNTHQSPNYEVEDPFYSRAGRTGSSMMHFADVERPDLGEMPTVA